jgi:hypothetical protein
VSMDDVELAAGWRARVARGYAGPVTVRPKPAGYSVTVHYASGVIAGVGTFRARYKADAEAERLARDIEQRNSARH